MLQGQETFNVAQNPDRYFNFKQDLQDFKGSQVIQQKKKNHTDK